MAQSRNPIMFFHKTSERQNERRARREGSGRGEEREESFPESRTGSEANPQTEKSNSYEPSHGAGVN